MVSICCKSPLPVLKSPKRWCVHKNALFFPSYQKSRYSRVVNGGISLIRKPFSITWNTFTYLSFPPYTYSPRKRAKWRKSAKKWRNQSKHNLFCNSHLANRSIKDISQLIPSMGKTFHRGWPSPPMRCQGFLRARITRARYPEMLCFFAVTSVTHTLARSFVFHSFPSFFLHKIQPSFAVTPFFIPTTLPFCAGQSTFLAKSGTFSVKSRTFPGK